MAQAAAVRSCETCHARLAWDNSDSLCSPCRKARNSALGPPPVSADFWESADLQAAFADRHMGKVIRAYRHDALHGPRPLPQDVVAGWLGLTQTQVSRIESGSPVTDLDKLIGWAQILRIPSQYLWFQLPGDRSTTVRQSPSSSYATADSTSIARRETVEKGELGQTEEGDDTRRKDFLVLAGASLANVLAPPLIHSWREQPSLRLPELDELLIMQLRAQTEGFRWLDRQQGAADLLVSTAQHARNLANFWRLADDHHGLRDQLGEIAADACHLVAYQAFDQGKRAQASEWYRCSAELAAQVGAIDLYVFAMCGVAYMHARNGESELAMSVLHQLQSLPLTAAASCYVAVYEAHGHASETQKTVGRRDEALKALDRANEAAARSDHDAPSPWLGIPSASFVNRQRALVLARLGDPDAVTVLRELETNTPAVFQRYRVTLTSNFALTYAHMREIEHATAHMVTAVQRNQKANSVEKTNLILEARRVLEPYRDSRAVRTVDEFLRDSRVQALNLGPR
jgi:transcriptional regulator with XRE-family HTH domain